MTRLARRILPSLLVAAVVAMAPAPAGATNAWHNNNGVTYSGGLTNYGWWVSNPITAKVTFNSGHVISCTGTTASGYLAGPGSATGQTGPTSGSWGITTVDLLFNSCTPSGSYLQCNDWATTQPVATFTTDPAPGGYNGGTPTDYPNAKSTISTPRNTTGTLSGISCEVYNWAGYCATVSGSTSISYGNPSGVGGTLNPLNITSRVTSGAFRVPATGQSLSVSGPRCSEVPVAATTATFTSSTGGQMAFVLPYPAIGSTVNPVLWYGTL